VFFPCAYDLYFLQSMRFPERGGCSILPALWSIHSAALSFSGDGAGSAGRTLLRRFWIRVLASLVDTLILFTASFPLRLLLGSAVTVLGMDAQMPMHELLLARRWVRIAVAIAMGWAYKAGMESSRYQATLGKLAMRLKVTDLEGNRLSLAHASGRYAAKFLSALTLGIGYLMVGFDEEKQGLHDRIAGTRVLYRRD
jgi:uncharacterized RDD family membrane protein YckC